MDARRAKDLIMQDDDDDDDTRALGERRRRTGRKSTDRKTEPENGTGSRD